MCKEIKLEYGPWYKSYRICWSRGCINNIYLFILVRQVKEKEKEVITDILGGWELLNNRVKPSKDTQIITK